MEKKSYVSELRQRLDRTLCSPDLMNADSLKFIVRSQVLRLKLDSYPGNLDVIVDERTREISETLELLRSASECEGAVEAHSLSHSEWKIKQDTDQLRVMYREGPHGTPFHTLLTEGFVHGSFDVCMCVSWELTLYRKWWPQSSMPTFKITELECLRKDICENIFRMRMKVPWPLADREALLRYFEIEYLQEGLVLVLVKTIPDLGDGDAAVQKVPEAGDAIHIDVMGGFVLQRIDDNRCYFRVISNMDIKVDFVPPWLINFVSRQLIASGYKLYQKAVSAAVSDEDYAKALENPLYSRLREHFARGQVKSGVLSKHLKVGGSAELPETVTNGLFISEIVEEEAQQHWPTKSKSPNSSLSMVPTGDIVCEGKPRVSPEVEQALSILDTAICIMNSRHSAEVRQSCQKMFSSISNFSACTSRAVPPITNDIDIPLQASVSNAPANNIRDRSMNLASSSSMEVMVDARDGEDGSSLCEHDERQKAGSARKTLVKPDALRKVHADGTMEEKGLHLNSTRKHRRFFCCVQSPVVK